MSYLWQMKKKILILIGLSAVLSTNAQDTKLYKSIVRDLCSAKYQGRGYVGDGVRKAADYMESQYRKAGADTVVLQEFPIDINTFPLKAQMSIDGKKLSPGTDFLMREYSPGAHGTYPLYYIDTLNYDFAKIALDLTKPQNKGCMVVSDFWFTYRHKQDFRSLEKKGEHANTGVLYVWNKTIANLF